MMNAICPYCNAEVEGADPNRVYCSTCGAAHHGECWLENGGCTVFGCASAPGEGPTVTVAPSDLAAAPMLPSAAAPRYGGPLPLPAAPFMSLGGYNRAAAYGPVSVPVSVSTAKNRVTYILLGVFLGIFGAHNFYAGYTGRAIAQLSITVFTLFFGAIVSWIWAIVEVCTVDRDSRNIYMI